MLNYLQLLVSMLEFWSKLLVCRFYMFQLLKDTKHSWEVCLVFFTDLVVDQVNLIWSKDVLLIIFDRWSVQNVHVAFEERQILHFVELLRFRTNFYVSFKLLFRYFEARLIRTLNPLIRSDC